MAGNDLPDEIIKEILSPVLKVSDDTFRSTAHVSPFSEYNESTSALLVVCKTWLRVSTPLLYHVVVLRSKAQAKALERALRANNLLGTFIKKLRVEGGFGGSMDHIIRLAPNITDLCLTPLIWSSDTSSGLCRGLPRMNPQRVIICDPREAKDVDNLQSRELLTVLCDCIRDTWEDLTCIELPYEYVIDAESYPRMSRASDVCDALTESSRLETIILKHPQSHRGFLERDDDDSRLMAQSQRFEASLRHDEKLKELLRFEYPASEVDPDRGFTRSVSDHSSLCMSKFSMALQSTPDDVKRKIWSTIIYFCLLHDPDVDKVYPNRASLYNISSDHVNKVLRLNILLVSKLFCKLANQQFYRYCLIPSRACFLSLACFMKWDRSLGPHIRSLVTDSWHFSDYVLRHVLSRLTGLVHLRGPSNPISQSNKHHTQREHTPILDFGRFALLSEVAGSTLETLTGHAIIRPDTPQSPTPLYAFTALRELEWETPAELEFRRKEVPPTALTTLESLCVTAADDTFFSLLRCMSLPALRHVAFPNASKVGGASEFLEKHGSKIITLKTKDGKGFFAPCPNLSVMYLSEVPFFEAHATLTKFVITKSATTFREGTTSTTFRCLGEVDFRTLYPALQEIQIYSCKWPTTERDIIKGPKANWVTWSDRLLALGIKLTDGDGKHWRPRLK
ncbi:hypothetical protein FPV67DRAFT_690747 [Lyophyllum atratum]|nr:hypothetical protein FPV67DRAFT_690747 [Lyophyllum atratum]